MDYDFQNIEKKRQTFRKEKKTYTILNEKDIENKNKFYALDMFPYPSWVGLHVGHPKWYIANDILARFKHMKGFNVLHPMGRDAFGLPAENYAIKTWTHPEITTKKNIDNYKKQISKIWFSYDREREINTTDPKYYKWTQRIFLKMFEHGLAYEQNLPINYCPSCKTWLANEEVLNNWTCERCWEKVEKKPIRQWVLAITKYADRLLKDVDKLDWPESIKEMQKNRIWKSEWTQFKMDVIRDLEDEEKIWEIEVYTTRIDTVFWMSYVVIAPDHKNVDNFTHFAQKDICKKYIEQAKHKSDLDRTTDNKEKSWVFTGSYVINPYNGDRLELWIWDYVLGSYWTWAVIWVPSHDERDFIFAKKYWLDIKQVITDKKIEKVELPFIKYWVLINSWNFDWLTSEEAKEKLTTYAKEKWFWDKKINYKLRDWLFSRQRYRWEPIPLIHLDFDDIKKLPHITEKEFNELKSWDKFSNLAYVLERNIKDWEIYNKKCINEKWFIQELIVKWKIFSKIYNWVNSKIVIDWNLPLKLPDVEKYEPAWDWQSPLANVSDFVFIKLAENLVWKRETNTMPQRWWSCWYYLRFMDPHNNESLVDKNIEKYRWQVDSYVWWAEHAVLHLLYARFWHKFLYDIWIVSNDEPFKKLRNQWLILAYAYQNKNWWLVANDLVEEKNWEYYHKNTWEKLKKIIAKMSKSLKNTVNPDDVIEQYWADTFRLYEMYLSDFKDSAPRDTKWIIWLKRFLDKVWKNFNWNEKICNNDNEAMKIIHKAIKKISDDIEHYKFNTAIAQLMIVLNYWLPKDDLLKNERKKIYIRLLHPFAPYISEELREKMWNNLSIYNSKWPEFDKDLIQDSNVKIAIQIMGKVRWTIVFSKNLEKEKIIELAKSEKNINKYLAWKQIIKEIYVPWKIINFVIK